MGDLTVCLRLSGQDPVSFPNFSKADLWKGVMLLCAAPRRIKEPGDRVTLKMRNNLLVVVRSL